MGLGAAEALSSNSADVWLATGGNGNILFLDHSLGVNNGGTGAKANAGASVVINNSMFTRNQVGLAFAAGGALASTKTNLISGSLTSDSAPSAFITLN